MHVTKDLRAYSIHEGCFLDEERHRKRFSKPSNLGGVKSDLNYSQWEAENERNQEWGWIQAA